MRSLTFSTFELPALSIRTPVLVKFRVLAYGRVSRHVGGSLLQVYSRISLQQSCRTRMYQAHWAWKGTEPMLRSTTSPIHRTLINRSP